MIARITEVESAPNIPCTKRATISRLWLLASPQTADAAVNMASPVRKTLLRPIRSPSRPDIRRKPANATR